jgi:hypothetical protein
VWPVVWRWAADAGHEGVWTECKGVVSPIASWEGVQVNGAVLACGLSEDCRHLLVATGNAFIFRFECPPSSIQPDETDADENGMV